MPDDGFGNVRIQLFVLDLLPGLRWRDVNTATRLICTTWQNGQNRDVDVVRPIHLSQVSNAAPTVFVAIDLEPVGIAVVAETAVEQVPRVLRFFRTVVNFFGPKTDDSFFPAITRGRFQQQSDTPPRFGSDTFGTRRYQTDTKQRY